MKFFLGGSFFKIKKHMKIEILKPALQRKCPLKVLSFLVHPPENGGSVKILRNWMETIF